MTDAQTGEPVANAIVWQDRRTAEYCDRLRSEGKAALFRQECEDKAQAIMDKWASGMPNNYADLLDMRTNKNSSNSAYQTDAATAWHAASSTGR